MSDAKNSGRPKNPVSRRAFLRTAGMAGGAAALGPAVLRGRAEAQETPSPVRPDPAAKRGGTLRYAVHNAPAHFDVHQSGTVANIGPQSPMYDTLLRRSPKDGQTIIPDLAWKYDISPDGKRYTFHLRKGVKFHDGAPFNAEAVKFSIERQFNPEHPANKLGKYPFANFFFGNVKAVEAMDDSTVRFVLKEPRASFLAVLTAGAASIVSPTAVRKWGADYPLNPVGTGPFRYVSWQRGQQLVLEKNQDYWKGAVKLDRVVYRPIVEDQARLTELMTGAVDLIVGVPPDFVGQLEGSAKVSIAKQVGAHVWYLGINNQKKPFDDKRVRQALNYAVNKDAIVKDVLKGTGAVSKGPVLPNTWGADAALKAYPYDPQKAKQLLAEAGYPNGFSTTLWVPESGSGMQSPVAMSTVMQSNLKAVGVNVTLQTMEWGAFLAKLRTQEQELFALSWMAGTEDPDMVMYPLLHSSQWTPNGPNRALYKNTRFDELLTQARLVTDQAERAKLYREAQKILVEDAPWIFVDHEVQISASSKRVQGFKLHPSFDLRVETISLR